MKILRILLCYLFISLSVAGQVKLSEEAQISILTSYPSDEEVYTVYGHTAIRIADPANRIDHIFNYGIFDFSKPNFLYRFTKGETDYMLGTTDFFNYLVEYQMRGSKVIEQIINLTFIEKENLWQALLVNAMPQNRVYRYNFFFDNCSTRPVALLETYINGTVNYNDPPPPETFREMINYCTRNHPWLTFGCDLALGSPTDRIATPHEQLFLPLYLERALDKATITDPAGTTRPLVAQKNILAEGIEEPVTPPPFTPLLAGWILFIFIILITLYELYKKTYFRILDCILFFTAGIAGCVLFFLTFVSTHPAVYPNWLIVWLHPFHLVASILIMVKRFGKAAYCYHFINFAVLTCMLLGWNFIPQHLNTAFIPLVGILWIRSGYGIYRFIKHVE
ncbi:MAG: DUF4105 domain-containing protein [Tannerellaceae bacterium]|nr:DUF4105 domain-containing protein [Tannerellaceae bacterium]